jgi:hydrogenase nickel incorporation protein HypB
MCRTCGCDDHHDHPHDHHPQSKWISLETNLLAKNDRLAGDLRARLAEHRITALNLIGAPGAGKTALLEHTIRALAGVSLAVIEGDQATDHDAQRIAATGCRVFQVNTGSGCHLDTPMIEHALEHLDPAPGTLLFIENVGNLVCPALFDLGERAKVVVMAVTEGEDKPLKYPHIFRAATALVMTKADLLPHVDARIERYVENARKVNPHLAVFPVAAPRGEGMAEWCGWLRAKMRGAA